MNDKTVIKAHGKINLSLDIIGRRPDGYHEVSMIMQSVSLADELVFEKTDVAGLKLRLGNLLSDDPEKRDTQGRSCGGTNCESGTSAALLYSASLMTKRKRERRTNILKKRSIQARYF